jgi:hypothetical protein
MKEMGAYYKDAEVRWGRLNKIHNSILLTCYMTSSYFFTKMTNEMKKMKPGNFLQT